MRLRRRVRGRSSCASSTCSRASTPGSSRTGRGRARRTTGRRREEAEERYGDYIDLVETGTEVLADLRDNFAPTLEDDAADEYARVLQPRRAASGSARFALEIEDR